MADSRICFTAANGTAVAWKRRTDLRELTARLTRNSTELPVTASESFAERWAARHYSELDAAEVAGCSAIARLIALQMVCGASGMST